MPIRRLTPTQRIAIGYAAVAALGGLLLFLPFCHRTTVSVSDAFFTSASSVFVTGLSTLSTAHTWTPAGDIVIAVLIQIGGAGITFVTTSFYLLLGRKISLGDRKVLVEDRNTKLPGVVRLFRSVIFFSFAIESFGTILYTLHLHFEDNYPWFHALCVGAFTAISAFNNDGFDLFGNSLESFTHDPFMLLVTAFLVIVGGLGFVVLVELIRFRKTHKMSLHAKVVLRMSGLLLLAGTVLILAFEWNHSLSGLTWPYKILNSFFTSTISRTAGFDSIPIGNMKDVTWLIIILLMFIGASPGSTGGGVKTTTFYMLVKTTLATMRGRDQVISGKRQIPMEIAQKSLLIVILAGTLIIVGTIVDAIFEPNISVIRLAFEEVSAYATVGLTTGITGSIHDPVKWVLIFTMYLGRIGILTFLISLTQKSKSKVQYIQERIFIG